MTHRCDVIIFAWMVHRFEVHLGIEILDDFLKLYLKLILDILKSFIVRLEKASKVPDNLSSVI